MRNDCFAVRRPSLLLRIVVRGFGKNQKSRIVNGESNCRWRVGVSFC